MSSDQLEILSESLGETYAVQRELGRGGMATVYLARDLKHDRRVAVKVLHPELAASLGAERFVREIRVAAALQHPHVLGLYESGAAGGMLYYVMPYVEGESLRDRLQREPQLPLDDALRIAAEVANALAYAHAQGIVHRDIKPENILLSNGHAVVADFGIARAVTTAGGRKLTESGMAVGTPLYMSPEQGMGGEAGPASDVYALGCVLYEMLVGQPPFTGATPMAIVAQHAMATAPSVRVVRATVPEDVEYIVDRALAKSPVDRWPSAQELERVLRLVAARETAAYTAGGVARRSSGAAPVRAAMRGRWSAGRAAALGTLAVLAFGGAAGYRSYRARHAPAAVATDARRLAVAYFAARGDSTLTPIADGFTEALASALGEVPTLTVVSPNGLLPYRGRAVTLDSIARAVRVGTLVTGALERDAGDAVRVTLTLRDASGAAFADTSLVRPAREVLRLREDVIDQAAALVRRRLGDEVALRASRAGTDDAEAWSLVQRGLAEGKRAAASLAANDDAAVARADAAADSLLALAEARDPRWDRPPLERARLAYARSRRRGLDAPYATPLIASGLAHADRALARDTTADALAVRGTLRYWQWLLRIGSPDLGARQVQLAAARADLERATQLAPGQADAWNALSHLYANFATLTDAKLAAKKAYDGDPFLTGVNALLWRLYQTSYDLGQFQDARQYCQEIGARFPADPHRGECTLWLLSVPDAPTPTPAQAWEAAALHAQLTPPPQRAASAVEDRLAVAAALVRARLADSARHVFDRAVRDSAAGAMDPTRAAWVALLLGDRAQTMAQLKRQVAERGTTPDQARRITTQHWWWRDLRDDREFRAIFGI